jgi:hypothetical protein
LSIEGKVLVTVPSLCEVCRRGRRPPPQEELSAGHTVEVRLRFHGGAEQPSLMAAGLAALLLLAALAAGALQALSGPAASEIGGREDGRGGGDRKRD